MTMKVLDSLFWVKRVAGIWALLGYYCVPSVSIDFRAATFRHGDSLLCEFIWVHMLPQPDVNQIP